MLVQEKRFSVKNRFGAVRECLGVDSGVSVFVSSQIVHFAQCFQNAASNLLTCMVVPISLWFCILVTSENIPLVFCQLLYSSASWLQKPAQLLAGTGWRRKWIERSPGFHSIEAGSQQGLTVVPRWRALGSGRHVSSSLNWFISLYFYCLHFWCQIQHIT